MGPLYRSFTVAVILLTLFPIAGRAQDSSSTANDSVPSVAQASPEAAPSEPILLPPRSTPKSRGLWDELVSNPILLLMIAMVVLYLVLLIPQQRQAKKAAKEQNERIANLKKNDRVVTSFGVHGIIANINSESGTVTIRIDESSNAKMTVERDTIRVVKKD